MNLLNQIWDFFASVKLAIFTLCTLAITSIIGTIIPQGESAAFYINKFGAKTAQFMRILDIPEMYYSWWFISLLGLLSANLIICSAERFPRVWKIVTSDNLTQSSERLSKMRYTKSWNIKRPVDQNIIAGLLNGQGWNSTTRQNGDERLFFSQKGKWSRTGVYIVHTSILVIFLGAIVGHFGGFKGSVMIPELNSTNKIFSSEDQSSIELGFEVLCNKFVIEFYENGMPKEYMSSLTVLENGKEVLSKDIEVNGPLTYKGITFYQSSYQGYQDFIFHIVEKDSGDEKIMSVPFQKQKSWNEKNIKFGVINAEAIGQRVVRSKIWFKGGQEPAYIDWLGDGASTPVNLGDKEYLVSVKQLYATGLQVSKDPGVWIVYLGCGLMLIGLYMAFFMSHRRIWVVHKTSSDESTVTIAGNSNKNKLAFSKQFAQIESEFEQSLNNR